MERKFAGLKAVDKRCSLDGHGRHQPASHGARARDGAALPESASDGRGACFTLEEASTGGASDGNFTAALGIPTLDGLGAVGEGAHARHESVVVEHLALRTALLAGLLAK